MLTLTTPPMRVRTDAQLRAVAASGASGLSKRAQAELARRMTERLRQELNA